MIEFIILPDTRAHLRLAGEDRTEPVVTTHQLTFTRDDIRADPVRGLTRPDPIHIEYARQGWYGFEAPCGSVYYFQTHDVGVY